MKRMGRKSFLFYLISLCVILIMVFPLACVKKEEKVINIGAILPLTGEGAKYGDAAKKGINLAVKEINSAGGINGKSVQIIYEDSQGDPKAGVAAMQKLVITDKVSAVIGDLLSSVTLAIAPIANKN